MATSARLESLLSGQTLTLASAEETRAFGVELGRVLVAGDLVLLTGDLAAGKTTLTQGIGEGLGVRGPITSPTFVIARVHPTLTTGPDLVHVDAYRLGGIEELDDLDLDADLDAVVTIVEWGHGMAETLSENWLEVVLARADGAPTDGPQGGLTDGPEAGSAAAEEGPESRTIRATGHGPRWRRQ